MKQHFLGVSALAAGLAFTAVARADGGYFDGVKGAAASGRGGAFVARADDVSAVELNPAGLTHIGTTIIQIGNRFSYNQHSFTRNPTLNWGQSGTPPYVQFPTVNNQTPWQALDPFIGVASNFGLKDWAFAGAIYSPAGTAREVYPDDGGQRYMMVRRNAQMINYTLSAAWKHEEIFGFGATLKWIAVPSLEYGLIIDGSPYANRANPVSSDLDIHANVKGSDLFTLNAILGAWVRPAPNFEIGLSGQILPSEIHTKSNLSVALAHPSTNPMADNSITLKRGNTPANDVTLDLPLPMNVRLGARYRKVDGDHELFDIELDGVYETWSRVHNFSLDSNGLIASYQGQKVPVGVIDLEKNWQNTLGVHLGGDFAVVPKVVTLRAGVYYETPVSDPAYANIDFPQGPQFGGALGGSVYIGKLQVSLATEYRAQSQVYVSDSDARVYQQVPGNACKAPYTSTATCNAQYLGIPAPPVNGGTYNAYSVIATLEAAYRF